METTSHQTILILNEENQSHLLESAKWSKFIAIMGFIGLAFMVLIGLFGTSVLTGMRYNNAMYNSGFGSIYSTVLPIFYIGLAIVYYFPVRSLYAFSKSVKIGLQTVSQMDIDSAFRSLKAHYKFIGIATIVILSLYLILALSFVFIMISIY